MDIAEYGLTDLKSEPIQVFDTTQKTSSNNGLSSNLSVVDFGRTAPRLIVMQKATTINAGTRTAGSVSTGFSSVSSAFDNVINTAATAQGLDTSNRRFSINFQTSAARSLWIRYRPAESTNANTVSITIDYSNDDSTWANSQTIYSSTYVTTVFETLLTQQTFQYARITVTHGAASGLTTSIYEVWEDQTGLGRSDLSIEVLDSFNNTWHELVPSSSFTQQNSQTGSTGITKLSETSVIPNSTTELRFKLTVIGKVNTAVTVLVI